MQLNKLTAALVASMAVSTAAIAAPGDSVTLYGLIDLGMQFNNISSPSEQSRSHLGMASGQSTPTVFGLRGVENIGGGNAVVFTLESGFNGADGQLQNNNQLFNRQATIGLRNANWGQVDLGRQTNMASKYFVSVDPFSTYYGQAGAGQSFGAANQTRYSNMIMYQTKSYSGVSAGIGYSFNTGLSGVYANNGVVTDGSAYNFGTTNNQRAITLGAQYVSGPLQVVATYDQVMPQNNLPGDTASSPKSWIIGGSYDFTVVKASLAYGQTRSGWVTGTQPINGSGVNPSWTNGGVLFADGFGANSYLVGLTAPVNSVSKVFASYQAANPTGNLTDSGAAQSVYSLGYSYDFSKRTSAYAYASYANNYAMVDGVKSTAVGVGIRHAF